MNKTINFSQQIRAERLTYKAHNLSSLAMAIAALSGYFMAIPPAHAGFNVPTDMPASPLCIPSNNPNCAKAFDDKLLMFEEFGLEHFSESSPLPTSKLPEPTGCQTMPSGTDLDTFLREDIHPLPNRTANDSLPNDWEDKVNSCLGLPPTSKTVLEGRPPGEWFAHQRWEEFSPQKYFQSAMTGARINGGMRDRYQMHKYQEGEFGRDGLYHNNGTSEGTEVKINHSLPAQAANSVWTFDGTLPPKLLMARYGDPILFRHYNALPIDVAANNGFGHHTISTHEHNGHDGAENDGYAHSYFYPGQFYDYHWPMILAGHDSYSNDPKAGMPDDHGGIIQIKGDSRETMSTHWFHDHMLDFTAQNVYKGNAAMMNYYSAIDRGREPENMDEANGGTSDAGYSCNYANPSAPNLCLPSGTALDWGNRDYDVNLMIADKAWDKEGQLKFNIFNTDGFLGDRITVNWVYKPYLDVRARRYRFRILNGSVSRYYKIAIVDEAGNKVPYHLIANDGNIMQHAIQIAKPFPNGLVLDALPEQGIAERYDIVIDFKGLAGKKLYFINQLEHETGKGPSRVIPLADILANRYIPDGKLGDPGVGKFLELRVQGCNGTAVCPDLSMNPVDYEEGKKQMIPLPKPTTTELKNAVHRTFEFGRSNGTDAQPWTIKTDNGLGLQMDPHRLSAAPDMGKLEIWHIKTASTSWSHPVHVHFEEGQILARGGKAPPIWEKYARKDVYRIGLLPDSTATVDIAIRFREFAGTYMEHCHNTQHEDKAMLLRWDIQKPGSTIALPTPMPEWDGVAYDSTITLPSYKTGDVKAKAAFKIP